MSYHRTPRYTSLSPAFLGAALVITLSLLVAPLASAATPVERHHAWTEAMQKVLDSDTSLTAEQVSAVHAAIREVDSTDFADRLDKVDQQKFQRQTDTLRTALSCQSYSDLVEDLGELTPWLAENAVAVETQKCNCNGNAACGEGYFCKSVNCTSEAGTRNWGMCREVEDALPVPTEPVSEGVARFQSP